MSCTDLQFKKDLPLISELNKHSFTTNSLDESSYVAMAGFVANDIHGSSFSGAKPSSWMSSA